MAYFSLRPFSNNNVEMIEKSKYNKVLLELDSAKALLKQREAEIEELEAKHAENPAARLLQKALAKDITVRVHSEEDLATAIAASNILFGKSAKEDLASLPESELLSVFEGVPQCEIDASQLEDGVNIIDFLSDVSGFLPSKGEAKRALKENSIRVNKEIASAKSTVGKSDLLNGRQILLQRGKKNYFLVNTK